MNRIARRNATLSLQQALEFHERFSVEEGLLDIFEPDAAIVETCRDRPPGTVHHASHACSIPPAPLARWPTATRAAALW